MALPDSELQELKARCQKAMATGFGVGKADAYQADLSIELGQKPSGPATAEALLALIADVEALRSLLDGLACPSCVKAPVKVEETEDEEEDEETEDEDEEEAKSSPAAPKVTKPKPAKKKVKKKR